MWLFKRSSTASDWAGQGHTWVGYLRRGLSRKVAEDSVADNQDYSAAFSNLSNLQPFVVRHWHKGALGAFLVLFSSLLALPQPLITRYLIDDVLIAKELGLLAGALLMIIGIRLAEMLAGLVQGYYFARFEQMILLDIQKHLLSRTLRFPKSFFDSNETGYLISRLTSDVHGVRLLFSSFLVQVVASVFRFVGGAALLFYLEWRLALVALCVAPLLVFPVRFFSNKIRVLSHHSMERNAQVWRRLQEALASTSLIKAFSSEEREVGRVMKELRRSFHLSMESMAVNTVAGLGMGGPAQLTSLLVLGFGAFLVINDQWTLGSLLAFRTYLGYVFGPAQFLAGANIRLQPALASLERVSTLFDIVPEPNDGIGRLVNRLKGEIEFRGVSFSYSEREVVLDDLCCEIQAGDRVAIVGPSGVGKSTLVSLLLRFYRPTKGKVLFDGEAADSYELTSLRQRIGYVSQRTDLLTGSIAENLRYGNMDATHEQVEAAARVAGIHDFIVGLPDDYESTVGEGGVNFSEGQKQRLSIARALIRDPDILILDEPTASLDPATEKSIFEALPPAVKHKTMIVVAHRPTTIQQADRVFLLRNANLVEVADADEAILELSR